jgi:hypothetical protein
MVTGGRLGNNHTYDELYQVAIDITLLNLLF